MIDSTFILKQLKGSAINNSLNNSNELKTMMQKYPYFQLGAILLTKSLLLNKDNSFRPTLAKTSTIVYNREVLFNILYYDILSAKSNISKAPIVELKQKKANNSNIKSAEKAVNPKPIISDKGEEIKDKKQLMKEVVSNLENKEDNKVKEVKKKATLKKAASIDIKEKPKATPADKIKIPAKETKKAEPKAPKQNTEKANKKAKPQAKKKSIKPVAKEDSIAIMEKFIKEDPSISKPEDKAYTKELDLAKSSLAEEYDIVSETMAKLFLAQGNKKKAKKIYEKLSLIFPEKNTYFAARISDL